MGEGFQIPHKKKQRLGLGLLGTEHSYLTSLTYLLGM